MKTDIFILKYGTYDELLQVANRVLRDAGVDSEAEAETFAVRMSFVRYYLENYGDVKLELKVADGRLYVSGESGTIMFTI